MKDYSRLLRPATRTSFTGWIVVSLGAAASVQVGTSAYLVNQEARRVEDVQHAARAAKALEVPVPVVKLSPGAEKWRLEYQADRSFPWAQLLMDIESSVNGDISLLEFLPDRRERSVLLRGMARSNGALLEYVERLARQSNWSQVHLTHQKVEQGDVLRKVFFEIRANYAAAKQ